MLYAPGATIRDQSGLDQHSIDSLRRDCDSET